MSMPSHKTEKGFDFDEYLKLVKIPKGAILDVASNLFSVGMFCIEHNYSFNPNDLLEALKSVVGTEGTLMIRTFTWEFCKGKPFDILNTKSQVGSLGNCALKAEGFRRTRHPIYSWMVWGKHQEELCNLNNTEAFGIDSPFDFLYKKHALQLYIGEQADGPATTIAHYAEKAVGGVPFRFEKSFSGEYIDENRNRAYRNYSMYVRPLNVSIRFAQVDITCLGIEKDYIYQDELPISLIELHPYVDFIKADIENNDGKLTVICNGIPGIKESAVDWSKAKFY